MEPLDENCVIRCIDRESGSINEVLSVSNKLVVIPSVNSVMYTINNCTIEGENSTIDVQGAERIQTKITGELSFDYSDEPETHDLVLRTMDLYSKQGAVDCSIIKRNNGQTISLNGEVSKAKLSSVDLFPSFGTWYRKNVYLIPLTLVSTILTSVILMRTQNNNKDKNLVEYLRSLSKEDTNDIDNNHHDVLTIKVESPVNVSKEKTTTNTDAL